MTLAQLERRVAILERKLASISGMNSPLPNMNSWIDEIHGTFEDDAGYREAARLGQAWRKAQRSHAGGKRKAEAK